MTDFKRDTGYAWVVCGASFWYQVMRGGLVYTAGVLFIMFQDALDASDSALALITSLHYSISFLVGMHEYLFYILMSFQTPVRVVRFVEPKIVLKEKIPGYVVTLGLCKYPFQDLLLDF